MTFEQNNDILIIESEKQAKEIKVETLQQSTIQNIGTNKKKRPRLYSSDLAKMKHSKNMLNYIHMLLKYKDTLEVLSELNTVVLDLLYLKNGNSNISNAIYISELQNASEEFSVKMLNLIALKIRESIEKINSNCNASLVYDSLLMYILEVKVKC